MVHFEKRHQRMSATGCIEEKGLRNLYHAFASSLVNEIKQENGTIKPVPRDKADLLNYSISQITGLHYTKKCTAELNGTTNGFTLRELTARVQKLPTAPTPPLKRAKQGAVWFCAGEDAAREAYSRRR